MILVLGGDGTLLGMAGRIGQAGLDIPILGVNFGSLGFLTEVTLPEMYSALDAAINGTAPIEERMMLRVRVELEGTCVAERVVLNDVVVTQGALSRVIDLSVSVDGEFMMRIRADGVIVASPDGVHGVQLVFGRSDSSSPRGGPHDHAHRSAYPDQQAGGGPRLERDPHSAVHADGTGRSVCDIRRTVPASAEKHTRRVGAARGQAAPAAARIIARIFSGVAGKAEMGRKVTRTYLINPDAGL